MNLATVLALIEDLKRGPRGLRGEKGEKGDRGVSQVGPRGEKGEDGRPGEQGEPGLDGVGPDEHVRIDAGDPQAGFLLDKLKAGDGIEFDRFRGPSGDRLTLSTSRRSGGVVFAGGGGGAHPNLAAHDAMGLATDAELAAHTESHGVPVYVGDTEPAAQGIWLWVDTNTDFLWYNDGQVG